MTDFGTQLKHARKLKKMTQKELAERLGVEQSAVSNYEKNLRLPATSALMSIAEQLNVSVAYLLGGEDQMHLGRPVVEVNLKALQIDFINDLLEKRFSQAFERITNISNDAISVIDLYELVFEPTLKTVGALWESGQLSIADEHIISDLIDRLLVSFSDNKRYMNQTPERFSAAFMLPGAEMHQFPLKMTAEIFKNAGWSTYYIGKSIPLFSLQYFLENNKVDVLVLSVTLKEHLNSCESLIQLVKGMTLKHAPMVLVGGSAITNENMGIQTLRADMYLDSLQSLIENMTVLEEKLTQN